MVLHISRLKYGGKFITNAAKTEFTRVFNRMSNKSTDNKSLRMGVHVFHWGTDENDDAWDFKRDHLGLEPTCPFIHLLDNKK